MTKKELLKKNYDMACHNLLCYSTNYLMDTPKANYKDEWEKAKEEVELLESLLKELDPLEKAENMGTEDCKLCGCLNMVSKEEPGEVNVFFQKMANKAMSILNQDIIHSQDANPCPCWGREKVGKSEKAAAIMIKRKGIKYEKIKEVFHTTDYKVASKKLREGWFLLFVYHNKNGMNYDLARY